MNNPKTIEAINEAVGKITSLLNSAPHVQIVWAGAMRETKEKLQEALNSLQEPTSDEHPLHAGWVLIDGEKRELRFDQAGCPWCRKPRGSGHYETCIQPRRIDVEIENEQILLWLSPPPAPVKEPEWEVVGLHEEDVWAHLNKDRIVLYWDRHAMVWTSFKQDPLPKSLWDAVGAFDDSGAGTFLLVTRKQQGAH